MQNFQNILKNNVSNCTSIPANKLKNQVENKVISNSLGKVINKPVNKPMLKYNLSRFNTQNPTYYIPYFFNNRKNYDCYNLPNYRNCIMEIPKILIGNQIFSDVKKSGSVKKQILKTVIRLF
jgi:hypothetical protein